MPDEVARERRDELLKAGAGTIHFAWAGGVNTGEAHYYRMQGKTFLIEYDNSQNNANHIHSVWRDFTGDFGRDWSHEHYQNVPHCMGMRRLREGHINAESPAGRVACWKALFQRSVYLLLGWMFSVALVSDHHESQPSSRWSGRSTMESRSSH